MFNATHMSRSAVCLIDYGREEEKEKRRKFSWHFIEYWGGRKILVAYLSFTES